MAGWRIPLTDLDYDQRERAAALGPLDDRWLSMGPEVQAFEREFAELVGVDHAIAVASGTAALHLAYLALDVSAGDEIVQPAMNFVAAANMTLAVGAAPVFADIVAVDDPTVSPRHVEALVGPRTRAIVVMHYGGAACRMEEITAIARSAAWRSSRTRATPSARPTGPSRGVTPTAPSGVWVISPASRSSATRTWRPAKAAWSSPATRSWPSACASCVRTA